jgi:hypothetical protein
MNARIANPTTQIEMTISEWARVFEFDVLEQPTAALSAAYDAKMDADFGEDEQIKTRQYDNVLLALVAAHVARDGFGDEDVVAIVTSLAEIRGQYRKDGEPINA